METTRDLMIQLDGPDHGGHQISGGACRCGTSKRKEPALTVQPELTAITIARDTVSVREEQEVVPAVVSFPQQPDSLEGSEQSTMPAGVTSQTESMPKLEQPAWKRAAWALGSIGFGVLVFFGFRTYLMPQFQPITVLAAQAETNSSTSSSSRKSAPPVTAEPNDETSSQPQTNSSTLIQQEDSTWIDSETGLMWTTRAEPFDDLGRARGFCENLRLDGYSDWRLPSIDELSTLYVQRPDLHYFNNAKGKVRVYPYGNAWSGSTGNAPDEVWVFSFYTGARESIFPSHSGDPFKRRDIMWVIGDIGTLCVRVSSKNPPSARRKRRKR